MTNTTQEQFRENDIRAARLTELERLIPELRLKSLRLEAPYLEATRAWLRATEQRDLLRAEIAVEAQRKAT